MKVMKKKSLPIMILASFISSFIGTASAAENQYYYFTGTGFINSDVNYPFCDVEDGCKYKDTGTSAELSFASHQEQGPLGSSISISYVLTGDSVNLDLESSDTYILSADNSWINESSSSIDIPSSAVTTEGRARLLLSATDDQGAIVDRDYVYVDVLPASDPALNFTWTLTSGGTKNFPAYTWADVGAVSGEIDCDNGDGKVAFTNKKPSELQCSYASAGTYEIKIYGDWYDNGNVSRLFEWITFPSGFSVNDLNTSNVNAMWRMFGNGQLPAGFNIEGWDVSSVEDMRDVFMNVTVPSGASFRGWNVSNVIDMSNMFAGAKLPAGIDFSGWDLNSSVYVNKMFGPTTFYGYIVYDIDVSSEAYSKFMQVLNPANSGMSNGGGKYIYVGPNNVCPSDDGGVCAAAESAVSSNGWNIVRSVAP